MSQAGTTIHLKIKLRGNQINIGRFHRLACFLDQDWPFASKQAQGTTSHIKDIKKQVCNICKGRILSNSKLDLRLLLWCAAETNVRLSVRYWQPASECYAKVLKDSGVVEETPVDHGILPDGVKILENSAVYVGELWEDVGYGD